MRSSLPGRRIPRALLLFAVVILMLGASIAYLSLARVQENAALALCRRQMQAIGQSLLLYANENKGFYPPDLSALVRTQDVKTKVFAAPLRTIPRPVGIRSKRR
jgi:hypothetical protein